MTSRKPQGVIRSLRLYHGPDAPRSKMDALYGRFIKPGDLVFDIGAHVGDRISSFRRLGARVIALEPQPLVMRATRLIHGRDPNVTLLPFAIADHVGDLELNINTDNPTVSTACRTFIEQAATSTLWQAQSWTETVNVRCVTLDALIAEFGKPAFVKIDVEGFEDQALNGLSTPLDVFSIEFTTIQRDIASNALRKAAKLANYRCNFAIGESQHLELAEWCPVKEMIGHLNSLPDAANSGDIYLRGARL